MKFLRKYIISILCGVIVGVILTHIISAKLCKTNISTYSFGGFESILRSQHQHKHNKSGVSTYVQDIKQLVASLASNVAIPPDGQAEFKNTTIADSLKNKVRILCWVLTGPDNHLKRLVHIKRTWGKRCNKLLFMSSVRDDRVGTIGLNVSEGRQNLWKKTHAAFEYVYKYHKNDADWFLKADDDTYVIVENLRNFLIAYSPQQPIHFGYKFDSAVRQG